MGRVGQGQGSMWERVGQDKVARGKGGTGQGSTWEGWDRTR